MLLRSALFCANTAAMSPLLMAVGAEVTRVCEQAGNYGPSPYGMRDPAGGESRLQRPRSNFWI